MRATKQSSSAWNSMKSPGWEMGSSVSSLESGPMSVRWNILNGSGIIASPIPWGARTSLRIERQLGCPGEGTPLNKLWKKYTLEYNTQEYIIGGDYGIHRSGRRIGFP